MCVCKICVIIYSMQASLSLYWLDNLDLLREQARAEGWRISRFVVDATEKANICTNDVYPKNQHVHLKPKYSRLEIQCKPVDAF